MALDQDLVAAALPLYEVYGELGRGAWGIVLAGRHRQLAREVAIKQLPKAFGSDPAVRARFIAEARVLASFDHPHVVPVFDFVEHEGLCLLVMERLTGGTLWTRGRSGTFGPQSACAVVLAACTALHYAHQHNVLHRDVKPENMMFSGKDVLKITDFGIAKVVGGQATLATRAGEVLGTPAYMAPEQAQGGELGPATDIYAVGTVLYELLAGQLPFAEDSNPVAMLYKHVHEEPRPLLDVAPDTPPAVAAAVGRALARNPADRFPDAEDFACTLAEAAADAWGPGWLPASGISVAAAGPVLSAAVGQGRGAGTAVNRPGGTLGPAVNEPAPVTPADLVPVNLLEPGLAAASAPSGDAVPTGPPASPSPSPPTMASPVAGATPPSGPVPAGATMAPEHAVPSGPPVVMPGTPRRRGRGAIVFAIVGAVVLIAAVLFAVTRGGGTKKVAVASPKLQPAADWRPVHDAPTARQEMASAVQNGTVWVLGGLVSNNAATNKVEGYDPAIDSWKSGPDLPTNLDHEMAVTYHGEVVVMGGWVRQGDNPTPDVSKQVLVLRDGKWVDLPPLRRPRTAGAAAVAGDRIVVFGGRDNSGLIPTTEIFDGHQWTEGPKLPTPRDHLAAASDGDSVYAVGGRVLSADKNLASFERYDVAAKRWEQLPNLPTPRGDLGATMIDNRIVAAGGETPTDVLDTVESYDIAAKKWSALPTMRTPRHGMVAATVGTSVYTLDGGKRPSHSDTSTTSEVLAFTEPGAANPNSPWRALHDAPTARQELATAMSGGTVWVFGGLTTNAATNKVEGYDPPIDTWKTGPDLPTPLHHEMAVSFRGDLVVLGGWVPQGSNLTATTSNRVFALRNDQWIELPPMNHARAAAAAAVVGDRIVVAGGQAQGALVPQTEVFDGTRWSDGPDIPTPRDHLAAVGDGRYFYAVGGRNLSPDKNLAALERYDPVNRKWEKLSDMPTPRGGLGATIANGQIVAVGGETPTSVLDTVEAFDIGSGNWAPLPPMRTPRHGLGVAALGSSVYAIDGGRKAGHVESTKTVELYRL